MIQLYFLSIVCNGLTGFLFVFGDSSKDSTDSSIEGSMKFSFLSGGFNLVLGILASITGLLKFLVPMMNLPILGDLVPALAGIAAGFMLIFGFYQEHSVGADAETEGKLDRFGNAFLRYKKAAGFVLLISALLHFLFPAALFL